MKNLMARTKNVVVNTFLILTGTWIMFALAFQLYAVFLVATEKFLMKYLGKLMAPLKIIQKTFGMISKKWGS